MQSSLQEILLGSNTNFDSEKGRDLLTRFCKENHFLTGLIAQKELDSEFYEEYFTYGLTGDFYYDFLGSDFDNKSKILKSISPIQFAGNQFNLYSGRKSFGIGFRIFSDKPIGFVFFETAEEISEFQELAIHLLVSKLIVEFDSSPLETIKTEEKKKLEVEKPSEDYQEWFPIIFEDSIGLGNSLRANRFIFVTGTEDSGKRKFPLYLYSELGLSGKILTIQALPESELKLKESMVEWLENVSGGILVLDDIHLSSKSQQEVLIPFLVEPSFNSRIILATAQYKFKEESFEFWELLKQHRIKLPDIAEISFTKLKLIIDSFYRQYKKIASFRDIELSENAYEFLFNFRYTGGFIELGGIIERAFSIAILKEKRIDKNLLENLLSEKSKTENLPIEEDEKDLDLRKAIQSLEKQKILFANKKFKGNQIKMAKALGISRGSLQYKIKQMEISL